MKEFTITIERAKEMEELIKIKADKTTIDSNLNVCCEFTVLGLRYYLIYEDETLVRIIICVFDENEQIEVSVYEVEQPKEITIYGVKITYTRKDIDLVNKFISECNGYIKDYNGIDVLTHTHSMMANRGLCDFNFDDTIINCKYGYLLIEKGGEKKL